MAISLGLWAATKVRSRLKPQQKSSTELEMEDRKLNKNEQTTQQSQLLWSLQT